MYDRNVAERHFGWSGVCAVLIVFLSLVVSWYAPDKAVPSVVVGGDSDV
jgi:hypothetical protein